MKKTICAVMTRSIPWASEAQLQIVIKSLYSRVVRRKTRMNGIAQLVGNFTFEGNQGFSCFFCDNLYSRRTSAESYRRFSSSVSGITGATGMRSLFGPKATNVR